jgi:hypothetical protein
MAITAFFERLQRNAYKSPGHGRSYVATAVFGVLILVVGVMFSAHDHNWSHRSPFIVAGTTLLFWGVAGATVQRPAWRWVCGSITVALAVFSAYAIFHWM